MKQYLNVPTLFGTTENAVYNQLFAAFIAYVLLRWLYDQTKNGRTSLFPSFRLFAVFSLGSFLSIGNPGWPLLCLSMPKFMEGVCLILDNQHS
ncbi:Mobile element protein [Geobacillus stearothermophilus]|uniref:Mobile element protein n=1 Tax=Geobacillus stearothermophilus TaxID=1422 RepID=A0ABQ7HD17_GEOSE|nr:Mobile element protein [Geobacillus stearothermophilus]